MGTVGTAVITAGAEGVGDGAPAPGRVIFPKTTYWVFRAFHASMSDRRPWFGVTCRSRSRSFVFGDESCVRTIAGAIADSLGRDAREELYLRHTRWESCHPAN